MVNKETQHNLTADSFFAENRVAGSPEVSSATNFKETLREQVLQKYLNYDNENTMGEPAPAVSVASVPFWKQKNFLKFAGALGVVLVVTVISFFVFFKGSQTLKGEIAYTEGSVLYKKTATAEWTKADKDLVLQQGYSIKVEGLGKAIANLDDGSALRLNDNTVVTLTSLDANHIVINNDKGEVYSRVAKAQRTFDVIANGITYRSMGTAYKTLCLDNTDNATSNDKPKSEDIVINGVEVYESKVQILGVTDNNIIVQQGEKYFVVNMDQPDQAKKVTEVSKADLQASEFVMWNKEQDEKVQAFKNQMGVLFDIKIPELNVTSPAAEDTTTTSATVNVSGTTEVGIKLTVNDVAIENAAGTFNYSYNLVEGFNGIKLVAEDAAGNKAVRNFRVKYDTGTPEVIPTSNPDQTQAPTKAPTSAPSAGITLSGTKVSNGISFTWNVTGLDVSHGFKLVKNSGGNPVYPGDDYIYLDNSGQRSYTWEIKDGQYYHFRVCQYNGSGTCLKYSNDIRVQAPLVATAIPNPAAGITVSVSGSNKVSWTVASGVSESGYKVVWSKTSGPTYPTRGSDQYQYHSDPGTRTSDALDDFAGYGVYYVRVCAYQNGPSGECSPYSNQVTLTLGTAPTATPTNTPVPTSTPTVTPTL